MLKLERDYDVNDQKINDQAIIPSNILLNFKTMLKEYEYMIPIIDEKKKLLEKEYLYYQDKLRELDEILPKLQEKKDNLEKNLKKVENDMAAIIEIKEILEKIF